MSDRILICDNTLREGEQVPGVWFSREEKTALFEALQAAGVDLIDLGIPAASPKEADFCRGMVRRATTATPGVSIRARAEELNLARDIGVREVYLMFPFSEIHIAHKFATSAQEIKDTCSALLDHAHRLGLRINLVAEDASRGSTELVCELAAHASESGIARLFLCDTVGAAHPVKLKALVAAVAGAVDGRCELGIHCHDDLGMATANTLAAAEAGATVLSATVNGLGERAGNAPLHEVALGTRLLLDKKHGLDLERLPELAALVEKIAGVFLSPLTPVVGRNAFRHESGIHVDGMLKAARVYEELKPELVGRTRELVLGKSTGRNYLRALLRQRGIEAGEEQLGLLHDRLRDEVVGRDKHAAEVMRNTLARYYAESGGFPLERFWELVETLLGVSRET